MRKCERISILSTTPPITFLADQGAGNALQSAMMRGDTIWSIDTVDATHIVLNPRLIVGITWTIEEI